MITAVISCLASCSILAAVSCTPRSSISPVGLRVEHRNNPSVIASSSPRMAWINEPAYPAARGLVQSAYRIIVASTEDNIDRNIGDTWDSGIVESDESYLVRYAGSQLLPGKTYWWKVQVRDGEGKMSDWSDAATFGMGLAPDGWEAKWIGAPWQGEEASSDYVQAPTFSRVFNVYKKDLVSAKVFVTGLGYFDLSLNGKKVGDDYLVPNFTNFGSRPGLVK
ncbi:MAG: alpha-L-rhamnosidase N-terminal domain-containing protein, partial [Muribaculaceae bacterium]|nr:alpha-L-rhamnosidase N-terminal domain-containing protein [Muribaculaceae bacterium]